MVGEQQIRKCGCGRVVGVQLDVENYEMRHQSRSVKVSGDCTITVTCDACGRSTLIRLDRASGARSGGDPHDEVIVSPDAGNPMRATQEREPAA